MKGWNRKDIEQYNTCAELNILHRWDSPREEMKSKKGKISLARANIQRCRETYNDRIIKEARMKVER